MPHRRWLVEAALVRGVAAAVVVLGREVEADAAPGSEVPNIKLLRAEVQSAPLHFAALGCARCTQHRRQSHTRKHSAGTAGTIRAHSHAQHEAAAGSGKVVSTDIHRCPSRGGSGRAA